MGVKISTKGLTKMAAENLGGLMKPMEGNSDEQYVILRVVPTDDIKTRGVPSLTTTVIVVGVEAPVNADHRRGMATLLNEIVLERKRLSPQGNQQEFDLGKTAEDTGGERRLADDFDRL